MMPWPSLMFGVRVVSRREHLFRRPNERCSPRSAMQRTTVPGLAWYQYPVIVCLREDERSVFGPCVPVPDFPSLPEEVFRLEICKRIVSSLSPETASHQTCLEKHHFRCTGRSGRKEHQSQVRLLVPFRRLALGSPRNPLDRLLEVDAAPPEPTVARSARLEDERNADLRGDLFEAGAAVGVADESDCLRGLGAEFEVCRYTQRSVT